MRLWIALPAVVIAAAILSIPYVNRSSESPAARTDKKSCYEAPDSDWHYAGSVEYFEYTATREVCDNFELAARVVIEKRDRTNRLFTFADDTVERANLVRFKSEAEPLLFVMTMSGGTGHDADLHFFSDAGGKLREWKWPDLDPSEESLLKDGEHMCCKDWNYHLVNDELVLVRGIYKKNDGNCCPSRGGIVVRLRPPRGESKIIDVKRVNLADYEKWAYSPFCMRCVLD